MRSITKTILYIAILLAIPTLGFSQQENSRKITDEKELLKLKNRVEQHIDSLSYHQKYISTMGLDNPELEKQYANWMEKYPKNAMIPYAIAKGYLGAEDPRAKPYLLKAVEIDPKFTEAWGGLWTDGERWGDFKLSKEYLRKATESDPSNPNYAFYYASSFRDDQAKYNEMSLAVAKRFPTHERGAQALYWVANRSKSDKDKMKYFELLKSSYSPQKFNWSMSGMPEYFNLLLNENPQKAAALAQELAKYEVEEKKQWPGMENIAKVVAHAKELIKQKKGAEALSTLKSIKLPRSSGFANHLILMKAQANYVAGNTSGAYDSLIVAFAKTPNVTLKSAIDEYGAKLGKSAKENKANILKQLESQAKPATPFVGLKRYLTPGEASLSDYQGKVVLLTYWFPGCGPCRGEFPHFENVLRKFKGKDIEYLGINIVSNQNEYVVPFMKSSGYSFTPLEEVKGRVKGNLDNKNAAPVNFLIDKQGKLYFSNFRTDGDNEEDLELMINLLMDKDA